MGALLVVGDQRLRIIPQAVRSARQMGTTHFLPAYNSKQGDIAWTENNEVGASR
jgi:hypothetical protein